MTSLFERLMAEATQLTRGGDLMGATAAIQRALSGSDQPHPVAAQRPSANDEFVLDGLTRVVEDRAPDAPDAPQVLDPEEAWAHDSFTHQGRTLAYALYQPPSAAHAGPRPLVLMLHGCTQDADDFAAGTRMNALARELGVFVLYPDQTAHANSQRCWNWFKSQHQARGRGEPALLAALTRSVMEHHAIDPRRVYVAGLSAGGAMADILGHTHPDLFAAVGVHSGLPAGSAGDLMAGLAAMRSGAAAGTSASVTAGVKRPPTIIFHGDADSTVHPANGEALAGATGKARVHAGRSEQGQDYTRSVYAATPSSGEVEHWQLHGAGHAWSGGSANGSYTDPRGVDASAEMLRFFLAHPKSSGAG